MPVSGALTPLVGREAKSATLRERILDPRLRLVTLTGPAGVGKSRLAAAVLDDLADHLADGGCFLDLRDVTDERGVLAALAAAVGDASVQPTFDDVTARIGAREMLVAIDHCERVCDVVSAMTTALTAACPALRVLIVNGEPLHVYGEWLVRLEPLGIPADRGAGSELAQVPSVRLFVDRAAAVREGFSLTRENETVVAELCDRLDGLPLAIEMAAARTKLFTPKAILAEMERGLDILQTTRTGTSSRHRTMRDALAFSCSRLSAAELALLARLAVFAGTFSIAAARLVAGSTSDDVVELVESLVDKNLLMLRERCDGELSFAMLGTTRAYAAELLSDRGEYEAARQGHAACFAAVTLGTGPQGKERRDAWLRRITEAHADVHAALEHLIRQAADREGDAGDVDDQGANAAERAAAMAVALRPYWLSSGLLRDGLGWLDRVLVLPGLRRAVVADVLQAKGELAAWLDGDSWEAESFLDEAAAIYEADSDLHGVAACQRELGLFLVLRGEPARAEKVLVESIDGFIDAGDLVQAAHARVRLAALYGETDRYDRSRQELDAARQSLRAAGEARALVVSGLLEAILVAADGENDEAERVCRDALRRLHEIGERFWLAPGVEMLAVLLTRHHRSTACWRRATLLLGGAAAMREDIGHRTVPAMVAKVRSIVTEARDRLGDDVFAEMWAAGRALSTAAIVAEALSPVSSEPQVSLIHAGDATNPLTAREIEVAELVSAGLTNRQIARRLGIAEWTVVNHLRKIMRKLDCASRVEVARWLTRQRIGEVAHA
ncbi:MAG: ATP-binding protein [Frankiaceae bacterium]